MQICALSGGVSINKKKSNIVLAYVLVLFAVALCLLFFIIPMTRLTTEKDSMPAETWADDSPEGDVGGIVTYVYTSETLPVEAETVESLDTNDNEAQTAFTEETEDTDELSSETVTSDSTAEEPNISSCWLEYEGKTLSVPAEWNLLSPEKTESNALSYSINGADVNLMLMSGTRESCRELILDKAESLSADVNEEIISYSPSRLKDMFEYDKYTLSYIAEGNDTPVYAYYFVSQADENLIYLVTVSSDEEIDSDNEMFGILEYRIEETE